MINEAIDGVAYAKEVMDGKGRQQKPKQIYVTRKGKIGGSRRSAISIRRHGVKQKKNSRS